MTIAGILAGRSGLPDFHDTADDWDPDLAWIDRETAVRRIMAQPLFEPGTDRAHSHSAYVLLAAILERATGRGYAGLARSEILNPLGMDRTGFGDGDSLLLLANVERPGSPTEALARPFIDMVLNR